MKLLVGFEESGKVRDAFLARGADAFSCDILPTRSPISGRHFQEDIFSALNRGPFDKIILHPPCTAMALSGNPTYAGSTARAEAVEWTVRVIEKAWSVTKCLAIEQPKSALSVKLGKRHQSIHPWMFGHAEKKETWLWLYGFPLLNWTKNVREEMLSLPANISGRIHHMTPGPERQRMRSETFQGVADAMAAQWSI